MNPGFLEQRGWEIADWIRVIGPRGLNPRNRGIEWLLIILKTLFILLIKQLIQLFFFSGMHTTNIKIRWWHIDTSAILVHIKNITKSIQPPKVFYPKVKFDKEMCKDLIPLSKRHLYWPLSGGINSALLLSILLSGFDFFFSKIPKSY